MLLSRVPVFAMADACADTLMVQTRTCQYTFKVGATFTYSYWLRLTPDLVNYSEEQLVSYITQAARCRHFGSCVRIQTRQSR